MVTRVWVVLVLAACAGSDGSDEPGVFEQQDDGAELVELDCRPVRVANCSSTNDRACFHVPPECAIDRSVEAPEK